MVNKPAQESAGESQRRRTFFSLKNSGKTDDSSKSDRQQLGGDRDESFKRQVVSCLFATLMQFGSCFSFY